MRMSRYDTISINRKAGCFSLEPKPPSLTLQTRARVRSSSEPEQGERRIFLVLNGCLERGTQKERERARVRLAVAWIAVVRQEELARKREENRRKKEAEEAAAWEHFVQAEQRQLQLRKDGQLARQLGEPLPGELPAILQRLAAEDRRQAERGLVALASGGKTFYKAIDDLTPEDMPARIAANRLRTTWLKERRDEWLSDR